MCLPLCSHPSRFLNYFNVSHWLEWSEMNDLRHSARLPTQILTSPQCTRYFSKQIVSPLHSFTENGQNGQNFHNSAFGTIYLVLNTIIHVHLNPQNKKQHNSFFGNIELWVLLESLFKDLSVGLNT